MLIRSMLTAALLVASRPALAFDQAKTRAYAEIFVASDYAAQHCNGMALNRTGLAIMRYNAIPGEDDPSVPAEISRAKGIVESAFSAKGAAEWCASVWEMLGPSGINTIMRN
jgi:hypothetical protein